MFVDTTFRAKVLRVMFTGILAATAHAEKVAQELSDEAAYKTSSVIVLDEKGQEIARVPIAPSRSK
jgi:hypothetical protein